jgi:predicted Zn-dependent peptidase
MERFKTIHLDGFNRNYYDDYAASIRNVSSEKLQQLAQKWLKQEDLIELVVGTA